MWIYCVHREAVFWEHRVGETSNGIHDPLLPLQLNSVTLEMREKAARVSELEWQVINRDTTIKVLQADRERQGVSALPSSVGGGASGSHDDPRATMLSPPASRIGGDTRWVWSEGCCGWGHKVGVVRSSLSMGT